MAWIRLATKGKGESVWLGWFLHAVLNRFIPVCEAKDDMERVKRYKTSADELLHSIEQHAWDGDGTAVPTLMTAHLLVRKKTKNAG